MQLSSTIVAPAVSPRGTAAIDLAARGSSAIADAARGARGRALLKCKNDGL